MIGATRAQSDKATELPDRMWHSYNNPPEPDVPVVEAMPEAVSLPGGSTSSENLRQLWPRLSEAMEKYFEEIENPSTPFRFGPKEAQGTSKREKIATLRSFMDKLKEDPEALHIFKKTLNDKQVRERLLLEGDSEIPAARTLLTDEKSTCHDLCSDRPASVDCMKQCTTPVSSNPSACLDVSLSDVLAKVEPVPGLQAPNQQVRLNYTLSVQNTCPQTITDVTYHIEGTGGCSGPSTFVPAPVSGVYIQFFSADPSSVAPGDSAGVKAGQDPSLIARCNTYDSEYCIISSSLPSRLSIDIYASGTDSTTNSMALSQEKIFTVLGPSDSGWAPRCNQKCPPATDTPSIVFVHGFKPGPLGPARKGSDAGFNCYEDYWGDAIDFLHEQGLGDLRTIGYYKGDTNCTNGNDEGRYSSDLHHPRYKSLCTDYHAGKEGTTWEGTYARGFKVKKFKQKCYDHSQALHDNNLKQDAHLYNCSTVDPDNSPCGIEYADKKGNAVDNWRETKNGLRGLSQLYYSITGKLPSGAERVGSSHRLWLLSTAATAWALLRR